jgi:hypothetical protein
MDHRHVRNVPEGDPVTEPSAKFSRTAYAKFVHIYLSNLLGPPDCPGRDDFYQQMQRQLNEISVQAHQDR